MDGNAVLLFLLLSFAIQTIHIAYMMRKANRFDECDLIHYEMITMLLLTFMAWFANFIAILFTLPFMNPHIVSF